MNDFIKISFGMNTIVQQITVNEHFYQFNKINIKQFPNYATLKFYQFESQNLYDFKLIH